MLLQKKYAKVSGLQETCQSGLTYLFAKEAGALNPLEGSNPSVSANFDKYISTWYFR